MDELIDFSIIRGDDADLNLTVTNSAGAVVDITGFTIFFTAKESTFDADADAKISKTVTSHTSPTLGITTVSLSATDTTVTPRNYYYDFQIKDTNGKVASCHSGMLTIVGDVTRRTV